MQRTTLLEFVFPVESVPHDALSKLGFFGILGRPLERAAV